jgi:hypothetical protein
MLPNACGQHSSPRDVQSSSFVSSGSNVNLAAPIPADVDTKLATSSISFALSLSLNDGIPPPPFVTCRLTRSAFGCSWSRFGPTLPLDSAAASV